MEYTVQKLAQLAGISTRTLRYYDEIGILKPARINSSGYRIYGKNEVDLLQQIMFYKELGVNLEDIQAILNDSSYDKLAALIEHRKNIIAKIQQLDMLVKNIDNTITYWKGESEMADKEKFKGFKQKLLDDNEERYGREAREKYGNEAVDKSNSKLMGMTEEEYDEITSLSDEIMKTLSEAYKTGDPAGELAQKAAELHKRWLTFYWDGYSADAHAGIAQMYVDDERFKAYYDKEQAGTAEFLRDAILVYTKKNK
ncbi:MAG: MerR family transcriptional regulator [Solirubrobacterales bacterium]